MLNFKFLLKVSRPRFWIYVFGPYLIGLAAALQGLSDMLRFEFLLFGLYFLFPANLLIYGINDIFDYEIDKSNPKKREYETLVSPDKQRFVLLAVLITNIPFVAYGLIYHPYSSVFLSGFLLLSVFYSAPPVRAKTRPLVDSLFNILYIFPGLLAYALLSGESPPVLAAAGAGAWTMAMHAYSAVPDITPDQNAKIDTIATKLGPRGTLVFCFVCYAAAAAVAHQYLGAAGILLGSTYLIMVTITFRAYDSDRMFTLYRVFPILNTVTGLILFFLIAYPTL